MCDGRITNLYLIKGILLSVLIFFSFACLSSSDNEIEQLKKQIDLQKNEINELKSNSNPPKEFSNAKLERFLSISHIGADIFKFSLDWAVNRI